MPCSLSVSLVKWRRFKPSLGATWPKSKSGLGLKVARGISLHLGAMWHLGLETCHVTYV
jgi:hypothetical protein